MRLTQEVKPRYYRDLEKQLGERFYFVIYYPLMQIIAKYTQHDVELKNAADDKLRQAIRFGRIQYQAGVFSGKFSAALSGALRSMGAVYSKREGVYRLDPANVPSSIKDVASVYQEDVKKAHREIQETLRSTVDRLGDLMDASRFDPNQTIMKFEQEFGSIAEHLRIPIQMSPSSKITMEQRFKDVLSESAKKFSVEELNDLYALTERNANAGYRFDQLIGGIQARYSISRTKSKFLARQTTAIFMSHFRRERFADAGIRRYKWSTSRDERVRKSHKSLDGRDFAYTSPPIVDPATGRTGNPGEDYNCRCVDIPLLDALQKVA